MTLSGIENIVQAVGWTLLHSIWQIGIIALVFFLILSFLPQQKPEIRYGLGVLSLVLTAILSAGTFWEVYEADRSDALHSQKEEISFTHYLEIVHPKTGPTEQESAGIDWQGVISQSRYWIDQRINWMVGAWLLGIMLLSARFGGSLYYLERLKKQCVEPLDERWQAKMREMANVLMINSSVELLASGIARTPMMMGHLKPVILIPASMLSGLSEDQLEAIIAHELAHIYRKDYWINLLQSVLEIIFFFHPAVWWMSSVVRAEREKCCDDLAVSLCGNSLAYVKALARVEEIKLNQPELALAFGGKEGGLLHRIERILQPGKKNSNLRARFVSTSLVMLSLLIVLSTTESQAIRYGSEKAKEALRWVKTSYLPVKVESHLPAMITYQDQEATQSRQANQAAKQVQVVQDTLPGQPNAPKVYSYSFHSSSFDSSNAPMVISIPSLPDLDSLVSFSFSAQDSILRQFTLNQDSLSAFVFNSLQDSSFVVNMDKASAPGAPMAFSFNSVDSSLNSTFQGAMALADSVMNSPFFASTITAHHFMNDSTLEARLRKLEQQMREREREVEALMREREQKLEMLLREKEAEFRQKEQKMLQEMQQQERELEQQMRQKQHMLEQQMSKQEVEMQKQQLKMEQEMRKAEQEMRQQEEDMRVTDQKIARLESQLIEDGLIRKGERYNLRIRADQILINDKKISDKLFRKYRTFMEEEDIFSFQEGNNISITRIAE